MYNSSGTEWNEKRKIKGEKSFGLYRVYNVDQKKIQNSESDRKLFRISASKFVFGIENNRLAIAKEWTNCQSRERCEKERESCFASSNENHWKANSHLTYIITNLSWFKISFFIISSYAGVILSPFCLSLSLELFFSSLIMFCIQCNRISFKLSLFFFCILHAKQFHCFGCVLFSQFIPKYNYGWTKLPLNGWMKRRKINWVRVSHWMGFKPR